MLHPEAVPAELYERIRRRAAARNEEVAAEAIRLLERALAEEEAMAAHIIALAGLRERRWTPPAGSPDGVVLLREDRDR